MKYKISKFFKIRLCNRFCAIVILAAFLVNSVIGPVAPALGQAVLPLPGTMVKMTLGYTPLLIKGMRVYPDNPLRFDFIVDPGDSGLQGEEFIRESTKAMKYFLSSLTVPEKDLWVNLSPFEKDRIIPDKFGKTEMGRDMLGQDYILKQLSASLTYPETELGKKYWDTVGNGRDRSLQDLSKVWIIPDKAVVYSKNNIAYVLESHLKVMMEEDYENKSLVPGSSSLENANQAPGPNHQAPSSDIFRTLILPQIEKEVNEGENFAPLRQLYNSLILATWFKRNLKQSILSKVYVGQNKIDGVTFSDGTDKNKIYEGYLEAFKKGVYNIIKEDEDINTGETIPRKYFSGGVSALNVSSAITEISTIDPGSEAILKAGSAAVALAIKLDNPAQVPAVSSPEPNPDQSSMLRDNSTTQESLIYEGQYVDRWGILNLTGGLDQAVQNFKFAVAEMAKSEDPSRALRSMIPWLHILQDELIAADPGLGKFQRISVMQRRNEVYKMISLFEAKLSRLKPQINPLKLQWLQLSRERSKQIKDDAKYREYSRRLDDLNMEIRNLEVDGENYSRNLARLQGWLTRHADEFKKADFIEQITGFLNGKNYDDQTLRALLSLAAEFTAGLSDANIRVWLNQAWQNLAEDLTKNLKTRRLVGWDNRTVRLVVGSGDVYSFALDENQRTGQLVVDVMAFMEPLRMSRLLAWDFNFVDRRVEELRRSELQGNKNTFVSQNNRVIVEVLRALYFAGNVLDRYYGTGPDAMKDSPKNLLNLKGQIFRDLNSDGRNRQFVRLLRRLIERTTSEEGAQVADIPGRIETALAFIINNKDLAQQTGLTGDYSPADIAEIARIYDTMDSDWFNNYDLWPVAPIAKKGRGEKKILKQINALEEEIFSDPGFLGNTGKVQQDRRDEVIIVMGDTQERSQFQPLRTAGKWMMRGFVALMTVLAGLKSGKTPESEAQMSRQEIPEFVNLREIAQGANLPAIYTVKAGESGEGQTPDQIAQQAGLDPFMGAAHILIENPDLKGAGALAPIAPGTNVSVSGTHSVSITVTGESGLKLRDIITRLYGNPSAVNMGEVIQRFRAANPEIPNENAFRARIKSKGSVQITAELTQAEWDKYSAIVSSNPNRVASSTSENVGGINLDPSGLEITETGQKFKFDVPIDPEVLRKLQENPVNGFVPVILNVVPIGSLPQFLGIKKPAENPSPVALMN